jgi:hypothetical protein
VFESRNVLSRPQALARGHDALNDLSKLLDTGGFGAGFTKIAVKRL